jgi:hypothetical protein
VFKLLRRKRDTLVAGSIKDVWRPCMSPIFRKPTIDGGVTGGRGQTWRRKTDAGWQYLQDSDLADEFEGRRY